MKALIRTVALAFTLPFLFAHCGPPVSGPPMPTVAPTTPTIAPTTPIVDPTTPTVAPTTPTVAPTTPTVAPATPTVAPTTPTVAPTTPTVAPATPTVAPTTPTVAPATPTVAPATPTVVPTSPTASPTATTAATRVRLDIRDFVQQPARLAALKRGVQEMKRRSQVNRNDPRGWIFQANIHGALDSNPLPAWNQCRHASTHFLSWHRAYVYYFERILREAAGDPTLTLPYWDWTDAAQQGLPAAFRDTQSPLFASQREMNQAGSTLPSSIRSAALQALNVPSFIPTSSGPGFGQGSGKGRMEQPPHDSVHVVVGGNGGLMIDPATAAQDPIFWMHHCNVDRLWEVWLRRGGGRANPTASAWQNETFSRFVDESGNTASPLRASQLGRTADLGYTYDKLTAPLSATGTEGAGADIIAEPVKTEVAATVEKTQITNAPKSVEIGGDKVKEITRKAGVTSATGDEKKVLLRLQGVSVDRPTGVIYEVYLNLPAAAEAPSSTSPHFIGVVSLFGSAPKGKGLRDDTHAHHASPGPAGEEFLFDVTKIVRTLARRSIDVSKLNVTVLPRGSLVEGKPRKVETDATVSIEKITVETAEPEPRPSPTPNP